MAKSKKKQAEAEAVETPAEELGLKSGQKVDRAELDRLDAGVPMKAGDPSEPQGPEDALGEGKKRGDYRDRQPEGTIHQESRPIPGGGGIVTNSDGGVDNAPVSELVDQNPRVEEIGDVKGKKGGVETAPEPEAA